MCFPYRASLRRFTSFECGASRAANFSCSAHGIDRAPFLLAVLLLLSSVPTDSTSLLLTKLNLKVILEPKENGF